MRNLRDRRPTDGLLTVRRGPATLKTALLSLLCLGLSFPLAPIAVAQAVSGTATAEARRLVDEMTALLDPAEYDVDALALDLAFERPEDIVSWMKENVRFEAYAGLLRGPQGTLVAGAGNALDQAVLLARLLGDAGQEARVVLGTLSEEAALALVMSMFSPEPADGGVDEDRVRAAAVALASATGVDRAATEAGLGAVAEAELQHLIEFLEAIEQTQGLLAQLGSPNPADIVATADLVAEARDYAWVEYRPTEADTWSQAHPAWTTGAPPPTVTAERYLEGDVPVELMHRLRIEMTIERRQGDEFVTAPLMTPWERPVANLLGQTLVVGNTVIGASGATSMADVGVELADVAFYAPMLRGQLAPGAMAFDLIGNLVPPDAAATAMSGLLETAGERAEGATAAVGDLGGVGNTEALSLTAQWIDIVLIAPGGEETRHRRALLDRRAAEARQAGTGELLDESVLRDGILTTYALMVTGGGLSAAYVANHLSEQVAFHLDVIDSLAASQTDAREPEAVLLDALADYAPRDHLLLFTASDAVDDVLRGVVYRGSPAVVALVGTLTPGDVFSGSFGVDIVANAKRALYVVKGSVERDWEGELLAGVWDTVVEREFVGGIGPVDSTAERGNAATEYEVGSSVATMVGVALAIPGLAQCVGSGASWLCYCDVVASGAALGLLGGLIGALLKAEGLIVTYVIFDATFVAPVTTLYALPMCSGYTAGGGPARAGWRTFATCWAA